MVQGSAIISRFPANLQRMLIHIDWEKTEEIRMRLGLPLMAYQNGRQEFVTAAGERTVRPGDGYTVTREDMDNMLSGLCKQSVYAWQEEMKNGFITVEGGHRVGLCGRAVMEDGHISMLKDISGINFRVAHEVIGACDSLLPDICPGGRVQNTLLISPPQGGKTTILRDLARVLSRNHKVTVVDERSELAGMYKGERQFDLGLQTDVLDGVPKAQGMLMAVRSLSPELMITDEIGLAEDVQAVKQVFNAGCRLITSIHGYDMESVKKSHGDLLQLFDLAIVLSKREGGEAGDAG